MVTKIIYTVYQLINVYELFVEIYSLHILRLINISLCIPVVDITAKVDVCVHVLIGVGFKVIFVYLFINIRPIIEPSSSDSIECRCGTRIQQGVIFTDAGCVC